jgi:uncharacterized protein (DUF2147 family)
MKRLLAVVALVLASGAARAQYNIEYDGKTIRIDPDRGTVSIPGVFDNTGQKSKRARRDPDALRRQQPAADAPAQTPDKAPAAALPASPPPVSASPAPVAAAAPTATAPASASPPAAAPVPPTQAPAATAAIDTAPAAAPPARDPNSPVGVWLTEEKEGKIRIESCGGNLCGYSVDAKSNQNREQILINMRPSQDKTSQDKTWSGRIFDPNSGSTYDSTIAMKGADSLQVQGCAFGGMFCGGQTWSRVN